jgi:hypothetical protein
LFKQKGKVIPSSAAKHPKNGTKSSPLDFHKMSSLKFLTEIWYFSSCELWFGGIWLQPVIWLFPGSLLPAPGKVQNSEKYLPDWLPGNHTFPSGDLPGIAVFWSTQKHLAFSRKKCLP